MTTIDEIEALLARATPGPWWNEGTPLSPTGKVHHGGACNRVLTCHNDVDGTTADANDNAALIVALRDAAPDLIAVVRAAAKALQRLNSLVPSEYSGTVLPDDAELCLRLHKALAKLGVGP